MAREDSHQIEDGVLIKKHAEAENNPWKVRSIEREEAEEAHANVRVCCDKLRVCETN